MAEEIFYNGEGKPFIDKEMKQPANWSWDYNNIKHVAKHAEFGTQREFEDSVMAKYKKVADGKGKVPVVKGPDRDLKLEYRKEIAEREKKEQAYKDRIAELEAESKESVGDQKWHDTATDPAIWKSESDESKCLECGKEVKGSKGLAAHMRFSKCGKQETTEA